MLTLIGEKYADRALVLSYRELTRQTERATDRLIAYARSQGFTPQRT